jgi:hypothetical protein
MKNFKALAVVLFTTVLVGGCSANNKAVVDARPARADLAVISDSSPDKPPFIIIPGKYEVRLDPATSDGETDASADPLDPLSRYGFEVLTYENYPSGQYDMMHNGYRIPIIDGQFNFSYVPITAAGCFSLAYAFEIDGSFVSSTEARGRFVYYSDCLPANSGHFIATLVTGDKADSGVNDAAPSGPEAGPEALPDTKDAFVPDQPCFNPVPGHYSAKLDPALSNAGDSISRLGSYGFTVGVDKDGLFRIDAAYDGWAHYGFLVTCGSFDAQHGQGWDGYGGTNCPTDGFGFVGSFVSPTEARGLYKDLSWRCQAGAVGYFIATLDPVPDSSVVPDVVAPLESGATVDVGAIDH